MAADRTIDTGGGAAFGDVTDNQGTIIGRDQIIVLGGYTGEQLEKVLARLQAILSQGRADLCADPARQRLTVRAPDAPPIVLSAQAAGALSAVAARQNDERAYLAALLVDPRCGRWAAQFVPLAGTMTAWECPPGWSWREVEPEFVSLEAVGQGPGRQVRRVRLDDVSRAMAQYDALVLLGEPGAGKTTTLYKLALDAARGRLERGEGRLPLLCALADSGGYDTPYAFVEAVWRQRLGSAVDLHACLRGGEVLLLCDAINEMPFEGERDYRARVAAWRRFVEAWPGNQVVFTCRSRDYGEPLGLHQVEIEPLDDGRVQEFVHKYLDPVDTALAQRTWARLQESPLLDMVRNPYYLNMLVYLVARGGEWPANRATLFKGFVETLLGREQRRHHPDWPGEQVLGAALAALADAMQPVGEGTRLSRARTLEVLPTRLPGPEGMVDLPPAAALRLGLAATLLDTELAPGGEEQVRFYHHQLQEYFAAQALLARFAAGEALHDRWQRPRLERDMPAPGPLGDDDPLPPPPASGWEEPTVLAAALAPDPQALIEAVRRANPALAARCLAEGDLDLPHSRQTVQADLLREMGDRRVHLRARIAAGEALGRLGDPRFAEIEVAGQQVLLPPLVRLPAGRYGIGSGRGHLLWLALRGFTAAGDERPRHSVELPAFYLGSFPVTNAEYACFVDAGGYREEEYWQSGPARAWLRGELDDSDSVQVLMDMWRQVQADPGATLERWTREQGLTSRSRSAWEQLGRMPEDEARALLSKAYGERRRDRPAYWDDGRYNNPAQPVVGLTWFEAAAYCAWLQAQVRAWAGDETDWPPGLEKGARPRLAVRLPSEVEWEGAARGGRGAVYPWGDRWDAARANTWEGHVLRPTPVGVYPGGATPSGIHDLSGNVWEWTRSLYRPYPYDPRDGRESAEAEGPRVVRGGSWIYSHRYARCAFRDWDVVVGWRDYCGFRVSVSLA